MSKNSHLILRLFQQVNRGDTSLYDELFQDEVELFGPASGQVTHGLAALKLTDQSYFKAYPGTKFELEEIISDRNRVMVRWKAIGTFQDSHKGMRPKRKEFSIFGISIYLICSGKIRKIETFWDRLGLLEQIGDVKVCPEPIHQNFYIKLLTNMGMEQYLEQASLLATRERQCLALLLQGRTAKETASAIGLSPRTVEFYLNNIKKKLKCSNKGELFSKANALRKLELI